MLWTHQSLRRHGFESRRCQVSFLNRETLGRIELIETPMCAIEGHMRLSLVFTQNMVVWRFDSILHYVDFLVSFFNKKYSKLQITVLVKESLI